MRVLAAFVLALWVCAQAFRQTSQRGGFIIRTERGPNGVGRSAPRGSTTAATTRLSGYRNEAEREEQFRLQQEMLARRKDPKAKAAAEAKIDERRIAVTKQVRSTMWALNAKPDEDPLEAWQKNKKEGKLRDLGYEETTKNRDLRFSIPLIASPIDQPAYDNGLRFDLRLPYAERGYEDADSDVMGKAGKMVSGLFGKKKEEPPAQPQQKPEPPKKKKGLGLW